MRRIVVTRFDAQRRLAFDIQAMLRERFGGQVCDTLIKENVALAESPMHGQDIFAFAAHSQGAGDYRALTEELEGSNFFASPAPATATSTASFRRRAAPRCGSSTTRTT